MDTKDRLQILFESFTDFNKYVFIQDDVANFDVENVFFADKLKLELQHSFKQIPYSAFETNFPIMFVSNSRNKIYVRYKDEHIGWNRGLICLHNFVPLSDDIINMHIMAQTIQQRGSIHLIYAKTGLDDYATSIKHLEIIRNKAIDDSLLIENPIFGYEEREQMMKNCHARLIEKGA